MAKWKRYGLPPANRNIRKKSAEIWKKSKGLFCHFMYKPCNLFFWLFIFDYFPQKENAVSIPMTVIPMTKISIPNTSPEEKRKTFRQSQPKSKGEITSKSEIQQIWDIIQKGPDDEIYCLVKYKNINRVEWLPYAILVKFKPQKVIEYLETRIKWPHRS